MNKTLKTLVVTAAASLLAAFNANAVVYNGNGNNGFGGPIGNSSLTITDDGTTVTFTLSNPGGIPFNGNDAFVLYLDTVSGGLTDTSSLNDTGDLLRRAISNIGPAQINFASGFTADKAIGVKAGPGAFAGLWSVTGSPTNLGFISSGLLSPTTANQSSYTWSFSLSNLGVLPGSSFNFVGIYMNAQDGGGNTFLSNEGFGAGLGGTNPGLGTATFTDFLTYTTVPEPSTYALIIGGLALLVFIARRRSAHSR
jgi:hypothetical protein